MEPFLAQIIMFAGNFAPRGWALCDGQTLSISENTALFSILGTTYGGDGRTTFRLPDLRGRGPLHAGSGPGLPNIPLGQVSGTPTTTLNVNNLPPHNHGAVVTNTLKVGVSTQSGAEDDPDGTIFGAGAEIFTEAAPDAEMGDGSIAGDVTVAIQNAGNGTSFNNYHPFASVNFIIALVGTFPSRNDQQASDSFRKRK